MTYAPTAQGHWVVGVSFEGVGVVLNSSTIVLSSEKNVPHLNVGFGRKWCKQDRFLEVAHCCDGIAQVSAAAAPCEAGFNVPRFPVQNIAEVNMGSIQIPASDE